MSLPIKNPVKKTCVSIKAIYRDRMEELSLKNKSALINQALKLYFERLDYIEAAEESWVMEQLTELRKKEATKEPAETEKEIIENPAPATENQIKPIAQDNFEYYLSDDRYKQHLANLYSP